MNDFQCSLTDCGQTFRTKYELKSHQLLKHNDYWKSRAKTLSTTRLNTTASGVNQCNSLIKNLLTINDNTQSLKDDDNKNIISDGLLTAEQIKKEPTDDDNSYYDDYNASIIDEVLVPIVKIEECDEKCNGDISGNSNQQTIDNSNKTMSSAPNEKLRANIVDNYSKISKTSINNKLIKLIDSHRFTCSVCPKTFKYNSSLREHLNTKHKMVATRRSYSKSLNKKIFSCDLCAKSFTSIFSMCRHRTRQHSKQCNDSTGNSNEAKRGYACDECHKKFISKYYIIKHKNSVHRKLESVFLPENNVNISDAESVNKNLEQKQEIIESTGDSLQNKSEVSSTSGNNLLRALSSSGKRAIKQLKDSAHKISDKLFYEFTYAGSDQKYYACVECGKRFMLSASAAKHHRRAHVKQRHYCDVSDCTFYAFNKLDLSIHRTEKHSAQHYIEFGHLNIGVNEVLTNNDNMAKKCDENQNKDSSVTNDEFIGLTFPDSDLLDLMKSKNNNHINGQQLRANSVETDGYCCDNEQSLIVGDDGIVVDRHAESTDDNENQFLFLLCPICGVRNGNLSDLRCHLDRTHSSERELSMRYACVVCGKRFMFLGQLIAHKNVHHRHKCDVGVCARYFRYKYELRFHQYSAHNVIKLNSVYW